MTTSAPTGVFQAIVGVMKDIGTIGISKARKNQQQGYNFRGIDDVYNELNGLLSKHNLVMLPHVVSREQVERQTKTGTPLFYTNVKVEFTLACATDGSCTSISTVGEAMDSGDKSSNKALSAAYKYAAMMLFCIPTEGDNDADATTHDVAPKPVMATVNGTAGASKAFNRGTYDLMVKEIRDANGVKALETWYQDNVKTLDAMPPDWLDELRIEYSDKISELKKGLAA